MEDKAERDPLLLNVMDREEWPGSPHASKCHRCVPSPKALGGAGIKNTHRLKGVKWLFVEQNTNK